MSFINTAYIMQKLTTYIILISILMIIINYGYANNSDYRANLPDIGDSDRVNLSNYDANALGLQIINEIIAKNDMLADYELIDYLNNLGAKLTVNANLIPQQFIFYAVKGHEINAFALPGGYICIYDGLIFNTTSEDELASVMSHEIAHIVQHHIFRNISINNHNQLLSLSGLLASALIAPFNPSLAILTAQGSQGLAVQNILAFSREFEEEADRVGQQIMYNANFDAHAMPYFFTNLANANKFSNQDVMAFLQTHPVTSKRISEAEARANTMPTKMHMSSIEFLLMKEKSRIRQLGADRAKIFYLNQLKTKRYNNLNVLYYALSYVYFYQAISHVSNHANNIAISMNYINKINDKKITNTAIYLVLKMLLIGHNNKYTYDVVNKLYLFAINTYPNNKTLWNNYAEYMINHKKFSIINQYLLELSTEHINDIDLWRKIAFINSDMNLNNIKIYNYALANILYIQHQYTHALDKYQLALNSNTMSAQDININCKIQCDNGTNNLSEQDRFNDIISAKIIYIKSIIH